MLTRAARQGHAPCIADGGALQCVARGGLFQLIRARGCVGFVFADQCDGALDIVFVDNRDGGGRTRTLPRSGCWARINDPWRPSSGRGEMVDLAIDLAAAACGRRYSRRSPKRSPLPARPADRLQ